MKLITLISIFAFVAACGNPHVSSVRKNIDRVVSPLTEEECDEALSEARVHTNQEQYESVAQCQEQEQQQQQQEQMVEESVTAKTWRFAGAVSSFGIKVSDVSKIDTIRAMDCKGSLLIEEKLAANAEFLGVTGPGASICAVTLSIAN